MPLSFVYAGDLSNNTISITVNADTNVIRAPEDNFEISGDSRIDAGLPYNLLDNYGLEGSVFVNSVIIDCKTFLECGTGQTFGINTGSNTTLIGEGIINSIVIKK
jgi:hypothetical protein